LDLFINICVVNLVCMFFLDEQLYCDLMRMKYGTTNIIRDTTGMGFTGVKPVPKAFPQNYFISDFILSRIMSCIHTVYEQLMFMPL